MSESEGEREEERSNLPVSGRFLVSELKLAKVLTSKRSVPSKPAHSKLFGTGNFASSNLRV